LSSVPLTKLPIFRRMKTSNIYRRFKTSLLLRSILIAVIAGFAAAVVMILFGDTVSRDAFPRFFICFVFFTVLSLIVLCIMLSTMTKYLNIISDSIDNVIQDSEEPIKTLPELSPVEDKLNELKKTLHDRQEEAVESEKRKNDMVLFLAHDLKTPLTSVIAYLNMLDSDQELSAEERAKFIHVAFQKALRLDELIREFFDITRYNLQDIRLEKEDLNLSMMLEQLADELYAVLQEKRMTCEVHTDEDIMIYGDPDKLARVFDNLIRNAISYSYPGTKIEIIAREIGEWIEILFCNRGDTIPPESLRMIFEKFYRMDDSRSSSTGGAGLGLAIAKDIVELHDGTIMATSADHETRFIVVLPAREERERVMKAEILEKRIETAIKEEKIHVAAEETTDTETEAPPEAPEAEPAASDWRAKAVVLKTKAAALNTKAGGFRKKTSQAIAGAFDKLKNAPKRAKKSGDAETASKEPEDMRILDIDTPREAGKGKSDRDDLWND